MMLLFYITGEVYTKSGIDSLKSQVFLSPSLVNQGFSMSTEKTENLNGRMRPAGMCRRFSVFVIADI
jgi:hypothetical protein